MTRSARTLCVGLLTVLAACGKYSGQQAPVPPGHLAFIDRNGVLAASMTDGSDYHELTNMGQVARNPAISINSDAIVFSFAPTKTTATSLEIAMVNYATGSAVKPICAPTGNTTFLEPAWDPGGEFVFFLQNDGGVITLWKVAALPDSVPIMVYGSQSLMISHFAILSDTVFIVTAGAMSEVYTLDVTTNKATDLKIKSMNRPVVSQDLSLMVFLDGSGAGKGLLLYDLTSSATTVLDVTGATVDQNPSFAPTIPPSFISFDNGVDIFAVPATGTGAKFQLYTQGPGTQASWGN
jgi:Tol biopolymer transport system component